MSPLRTGIVFGLALVLAFLTFRVEAQDCANVEFALFSATGWYLVIWAAESRDPLRTRLRILR